MGPALFCSLLIKLIQGQSKHTVRVLTRIFDVCQDDDQTLPDTNCTIKPKPAITHPPLHGLLQTDRSVFKSLLSSLIIKSFEAEGVMGNCETFL